MAVVADAPLLAWLETHSAALGARDPEALRHASRAAIAHKARIVADDERETTGPRATLNFGHTIGHALEAHSGYALLHGEAVALFGELQVSDVMVHRTNMITVDADNKPEDIVNTAIESPVTRLPLWSGNPENIIGVVHAKDLLRAYAAGRAATWRRLRRPTDIALDAVVRPGGDQS